MFSALANVTAPLVLVAVPASAADTPNAIAGQLPPGYAVLGSARASVESGQTFYFVALGSKRELKGDLAAQDRAPARPLLIFEQRPNGRYELVGRNDDVVMRADDGGIAGNGCDPFEEHHIAVKGAYVTVENGVSCGAHWTDYVTFRFDPAVRGYVFDNWRFESWKLNPSSDPDAEALAPDAHHLVRPRKGHTVPFASWRRPD
jgi:hypothetical protein